MCLTIWNSKQYIGYTCTNENEVCKGKPTPYMTKALRKAITIRSSLKNKLHNNFTPNNSMAYKKQRNYCSRLYKKEREKYYEKLNVKNVTDNKEFWETVKPFLSDGKFIL